MDDALLCNMASLDETRGGETPRLPIAFERGGGADVHLGTAQKNPSRSLAASDIMSMVHAGSQTSSTRTLATP